MAESSPDGPQAGALDGDESDAVAPAPRAQARRPQPQRPPPEPQSAASKARTSMILKVVAIGIIVIVLLIPLTLLSDLIKERQQLRDTARHEVAAQWGQEQTLGGPVLTVPYTVNERNGEGQVIATTRYAHFLPDNLYVEGNMTTEVRTKGIFRVVLYNADLAVSGRFPSIDPGALGIPPASLRLDEAFIQIGIPDMAGIRDEIELNWGGVKRAADPGIATDDVFQSGVSVPVRLGGSAPGARGDSAGTDFSFALNLNGSGSLGVLPVGKETTLELRAPWDTPNFAGAFLPEDRTVSDSGFVAKWRVLNLNRNYPQAFTGSFNQPTALDLDQDGIDSWASSVEMDFEGREISASGASSVFGVELLLPVDEYQKANRAAKYGILFVFLTFLTFFFVEILAGRRFHPIQYLLVGFAVSIFYLLLLAFAEHVTFGLAYAGAAVASIGLVTLYARAVFGEWRLAVVVGALLAIFTGYFYVLLQMETFALLIGSLGLFATLAVTMYLSRKVDWYGEKTLADESPKPDEAIGSVPATT